MPNLLKSFQNVAQNVFEFGPKGSDRCETGGGGSSDSEELLSNQDVHLTFWFSEQYPLQAEHHVCP